MNTLLLTFIRPEVSFIALHTIIRAELDSMLVLSVTSYSRCTSLIPIECYYLTTTMVGNP